jgi:uncharacterized protein with PIN domain
MVWREMNTHFDHTRCPNCNAGMRLAKVEPRPVRNDFDFESHFYQCDRCLNMSKFVIDKKSRAEIEMMTT